QWLSYLAVSWFFVYVSAIYLLITEDRLNFKAWVMGNGSLAKNSLLFFAGFLLLAIILNLCNYLWGKFDKKILGLLIKRILLIDLILALFLTLRLTPILTIFDSPYFSPGIILGSREILVFFLAVSWAIVGAFYLLNIKFPLFFRKPIVWIVGLVLVGTILQLLNSIMPYINFQAPASDLGLFNQVIYNFSRFVEPTSTIRGVIHIWADHFHPILLTLTPLYWFFKGPVPILVVQASVASSAAIPIYLIIKDKTKNTFLSWAGSFSYLFFVGLQNALNFGFYPENMAPAMFAWAFWFFLRQKFWPYFLFLILWLACKEDISIFAVFLGIYLIFFEKNIKYNKLIGLITIIIGLVWYKLATGVIIPHYADQFFAWAKTSSSAFMYFNYDQLGNTPLEVVKTIIKNPFYTFYIFTHPEIKIFTLMQIVFSYGALFIFAPFSIIALPIFLESFLANRQTLWEFHFHYQAAYSAVLAIASGLAVKNLADRFFRHKEMVYLAGGLTIIFSIILTNALLNSPFLGLRNYNLLNFSLDKNITDILDKIPAKASVSAQNTLAPYLSQREKIYLYPRADDVQYIVLAPEFSHFPLSDENYYHKLCNIISQPNDFQLTDYNDKVLLFIRSNENNQNNRINNDLVKKYCPQS
ncbi:MAG: DUF2079 domain-containing protein, partial [Patescibacteria group bacterium]|nr:DUF2079 domain-containing protein [Patescibacteria group bacterium]